MLVVSGASTVPAMSAAVIDEHRAALRAAGGRDHRHRARQQLRSRPRHHAIDPGHARPAVRGASRSGSHGGARLAGPATAGRSRASARAGSASATRPTSICCRGAIRACADVRVFAALEVGAFHLGLWGLSWLVRGGLLRKPERLAGPLLAAEARARFLGSDVVAWPWRWKARARRPACPHRLVV